MGARYEADVVVVGAGLAGLVTALELLEAGRSVVLLEGGPEERLGGLARVSFGGIFVVGSREQRRAGIRDSVDLALQDWLRYGELDRGESWPRRWAEAYVASCREDVYEWVRGLGVRFFPVVHWVERGLQTPGNSVPRFHMVWGTGQRLVECVRAAIETHRHRDRLLLLCGHRVTELVREGGRFVGASGRVTDAGGHGINRDREFEARGGAVVIAAGGITGNLERVRRHWPEAWGPPPKTLLSGSHPAADGALHDVVVAHGGSVTHLDRMWHYAAGVHHWRPEHPHHGLSLVPPKSALWLDYRGRRLGPPPLVTGYDTRYLVEAICRRPVKYSWQVLNARIARRELAVSGSEFNHAMRDRRLLRFLATTLLGNPALVREFVEHCPDFVVADSVPELAERMNELAGTPHVEPAALTEEIARYDAEVTRGKDSTDEQVRLVARARRYRGDRVRTCRYARIDDPRGRPLIAIREFIVTRKSLGGMQTDLDCRVLDQEGAPLPGLYAVGEAAGFGGGGVHGIRSLEGTFLGGCIFGGRRAAAAIAGG